MSHTFYLELHRSDELARRAETALEHLKECDVCPNRCGVDRGIDERGACDTGRRARVSSYGPHHGEERPLSGTRGSGTIFFSGCNLSCRYCQNHDISQGASGREMDPGEIAEIMLDLQGRGCHNINFVSPTHVIPQILEALEIAVKGGLHLPLVYNTGGYDSVEMLRLLDGIIGIYMPDMKYSDPEVGRRLSLVPQYPDINRAAVREMHGQVGDLILDDRGIASRGLLVRHLVLPNGLAGTEGTMKFLAEEISRDTYVNVMDQYHPEYMACDIQPLNRRLTGEEFNNAVSTALGAGLHRLDGFQ